MPRTVKTEDDLDEWTSAVFRSELDERTKLALLVVAEYVAAIGQFVGAEPDDWNAYVSQTRAADEFNLTRTSFGKSYRRAKKTGWLHVVETRHASVARWDDHPWTDRLELTFPE
jgi:hypothetical protein